MSNSHAINPSWLMFWRVALAES